MTLKKEEGGREKKQGAATTFFIILSNFEKKRGREEPADALGSTHSYHYSPLERKEGEKKREGEGWKGNEKKEGTSSTSVQDIRGRGRWKGETLFQSSLSFKSLWEKGERKKRKTEGNLKFLCLELPRKSEKSGGFL